MNALKVSAPRKFSFGPLDRIIIRFREYRWISSDDYGHILSPVLGIGEPIPEGFSHEELDDFANKDQLQHQIRYYDEAKTIVRLKNGGACSLFELLPREQRKILDRQEILDLVRQYEATDPDFVRSDAHLEKVMKVITLTLLHRNQARAAQDKGQRCDQTFEMSKPPSPRTIRRWWRAYESSGFDVMSLRDGHFRSGNPFSELAPDVVQVMDQHVAGWADRRRPTMSGQYDAMATEIRAINDNRAPNERLSVPAKETFRKAIKAIPAFDAYAARHGIEAAKRKFAVVGTGMETVRAFQRLIMDGHKVQLSTIAVKLNEWDALSPEAKRKAERGRLVLHLSICAASRCVTGIRLAKTETSDAAVALLRMSVSDKSHYARAAGCRSDWPMTARPGSVHTDTGPAWIATEFRSSVADMRATIETAPVGLPQMRGHGERMFGTLDRGLLPHFSGRAFGSIAEKGDYDPAADASIFSETLGFAYVRYIVDKYHHTPHASLNGMTPYNKWLELVDRYGILPPPSQDELRNIFGLRVQRAVDQRGIRVASIQYQSERLQAFRRRVGDTEVAVKFDSTNLAKISAWVDDGWLSVPAICGSFAGVHLDEWTEAVRDLRRRNLVQSSLSQHYVDDAIRDLASMGRLAIARADLSATTTSVEDLVRAERELLFGFDIVPPEDADSGTMTTNRDNNGNRDRFANAIPITGSSLEINRSEPPTEGPSEAPPKPVKPVVRKRNSNLNLED